MVYAKWNKEIIFHTPIEHNNEDETWDVKFEKGDHHSSKLQLVGTTTRQLDSSFGARAIEDGLQSKEDPRGGAGIPFDLRVMFLVETRRWE